MSWHASPTQTTAAHATWSCPGWWGAGLAHTRSIEAIGSTEGPMYSPEEEHEVNPEHIKYLDTQAPWKPQQQTQPEVLLDRGGGSSCGRVRGCSCLVVCFVVLVVWLCVWPVSLLTRVRIGTHKKNNSSRSLALHLPQTSARTPLVWETRDAQQIKTNHGGGRGGRVGADTFSRRLECDSD